MLKLLAVFYTSLITDQENKLKMLSASRISSNIPDKPPLGKYIEHLSLFFVLTENYERNLLQNMDKHLSMQAACCRTKANIRFPGE